MATFDRKAAKKKLLKRTQEQSQKKDQGQFGSIFKRTDLPMFFPENGKHKVDIIPYLAGKHDPQVAKGDPTYLLDIWVHRGAGIGDDPYVCLAKNYKKNCPICNYRKQYEADLDEDTLKGLLPKRRTIYNVVDRTTESDRKKGVQVWEIAHFFMEKHLLAQAENPDGGGVAAYADTEEGSTVFFRKSGSKDTTTYDGHKLLPREYKIKDKILEQAFTLDELIHIPTEEELDNVVKGLKRKSKSQQADDDDDEMEDEDEEETTSKRKKSKKRDEEEDVDDSNFDDDDEDDDDEKPKKKKAKKQDDDDEDDDEEDEDEDEKPKKKKSKFNRRTGR